MYCEKCGRELRDNEKFCPACGAANEINNRTAPGQNYMSGQANYMAGYAPAINQKKSPVKWILLGVGIIALIAIMIFVANNFKESEPLNFNLQVVNNTGIDIYALYASEVDTDNWEEDILGSQILYDGETMVIEFTITEEDMDWDFAMEDSEGNMIEFYDLSFEGCDPQNSMLVLEYDTSGGTATLY